MKINIKRYIECDEVLIDVTFEDCIPNTYKASKFYLSNVMYSHIIAFTLNRLNSAWSYEVYSENLSECLDDSEEIFTCEVYHRGKKVIKSEYNGFNGRGEGVGIKQTIDAFSKFGIEIEIEQDTDAGGWCYDEK